jgi:hypothetical protein
MAGNEVARNNLGEIEFDQFSNYDRAIKHWIIAASTGEYHAMDNLLAAVGKGMVSRDAIDVTLTAYNNACAEMRSEERDAAINRLLMVVYVENLEDISS